MIPEELHLRNFLSHRESDLDLRSVHLASLVGENGAGKSALLDGITWCVWGRSRAPYGRDEDLIYHGEAAIEVEFMFRMPYQGGDERRFRILRRRELRGRRSGSSVLDFQVQGDAGWRLLNGNSIRETQKRIEEQLGLDYDTFANSAYLRQGHADEFTVQTPADRKRVLGAVLGLERWAEYQERAKKQLAGAQGRLEELRRRLAEIEAELARRGEVEAALAQAEADAVTASARLQATQAEVNELTRWQEQAAALQRQLQALAAQQKLERERLTALEQQASSQQQKLEAYQARIAQAEAIQARYAAYQAALAAERAWGEKLSQAARLQEEKSHWEQAIAAAGAALREERRALEQEAAQQERVLLEARGALERELRALEGQMRLLDERIPGPAFGAELEAAEGRLAELEALEQAREAARAALQQAEVERSRLTERNRQLKAFMDETKARLDALAEAEAACPLCRQPLTSEHQARLLDEIETEGRGMGDEFRANAQRLRDLQDEDGALKSQLREHERASKERPRVEQTVARLRQQQEQGVEANTRLEALGAQAAALQTRMAAGEYAPEVRAARAAAQARVTAAQARLDAEDYALEARASLAATLAELAELGYEAPAHVAARQRVQELAAAEAEYRELEMARVGIAGAAEALKRLAQELAAQQTRIAQLATEQQAQQAALAALQPQLAAGPALLQALAAARQADVEARQRVGAARQTLAALDTQAKRLARLVEERESLATRVGLFTELREAFGVNGIPAMIIEHTLPELEREANRILEQLTGGRMHIRFETQRETKAGDLRETLDIIISDEKSARPYENFSGGEQFRVNFAIRVALSRLLAQRAGVRLRSLFVDEGFGSLDADGRRRLVEALKAVQNDFDLILVITHIEELQDVFPVRIQVLKTESGSVVDVV